MAIHKLITTITCFVIALADLLFFTSAFVFLAKDQNQIHHEIFSFSFGTSTFDLVILSLTRFCLLFGACIGLLCNIVHGAHNLNSSKRFIIYYGCFTAIYIVIKIMYFTEDSQNNMPARVWFMLGITLVTIVTTSACWKLLSITKCTYVKKNLKINRCNDGLSIGSDSVSSNGSESILNDNEDDGDEDDDDDDEDEDDDEDDGGCKMNPKDKKAARNLSGLATIWKLVMLAKKDLGYVFIAFIFLVTCSICEVFLPYYTGNVLNYIIIDKSLKKFKESMLYMALLALLAGFSAGMRGGLLTYIFGRYTLRLQNTLFSKIMKMEIGFFDERKTGEITSRLTSDCTKIGDGIGLNLNVFLRSFVQMIGILFFMIKLSWKLTIVMIITFPVIGIISEFFGKKYQVISEKVQSSLAHANSCAEESLSSIRTVRSFAAEEVETNRYAKRLSKTLSLKKKEGLLTSAYEWSLEITDLVMLLLILYYGGHLVMLKDLSGGHLISFVLYSWDMSHCFEEIGDVFTGLMEVIGSAKNVCLYIDREPMISNNGAFAPENGINGNIEFKDVSFSYPTREDIAVLDDINFTVHPGEVVALVGPSGGGKTSIVNLLQHFYEPNNGKILIDGIDVKEYEHHFLHEKMSLVQQEPVLFARKLSENIIYGLQFEVTDNEIEEAAKLANAHSFILNLPETYRTETGEKGVQLSGGQKQRIAIARAMIRKPTILLLDEATSALDSESEHLVQQAINKTSVGRAVIIIAHRLSTVEKADKILVIDKGKIVEKGKHQELIDKQGYYAGLVKRQILGLNDEDIPIKSPIPSNLDSLGSSVSTVSSESSSYKGSLKV